MSRARAALPWALLALGFVVRAALVGYEGMVDVAQYGEWGEATYRHGLTSGFEGIYFPFQYQLFAAIHALGDVLGGAFFVWLKITNLAFDCGIVALLFHAAKDHEARLRVCLMYWLNPWFVALFSLGYCDFQIGFFVLALLTFFREDASPKRALLAGVPLALAFLMKPQAMVLVLMMGFLGAFLLLRNRKALPPLVWTLVPAVVLFLLYSAWFKYEGHAFRFLARTYLRTSAVMPSLTADMLNVWHPLATLLHPDQPVWGLRDDTQLWSRLTYRHVALASTLLAMLGYAGALVMRRAKGYSLTHALTFSAIVVPMVMSGAHENHLYLGMAGMVLLAVRHDLPRHGLLLFTSFCTLATLNLVGHYALGQNPLSDTAPVFALSEAWKSTAFALTLGVLMIVTFLGALAAFFEDAGRTRRDAFVPVVLAVLLLAAVYGTVATDVEEFRGAPTLARCVCEAAHTHA